MSRKMPDYATRERLLIGQRGCCIYCLLPLDSIVYRAGRSYDYELEWDHFVPFAYVNGDPEDNWVAACQICNGIKSDLQFRNLTAAREHIQARRQALGYSTVRPSWQQNGPEERYFSAAMRQAANSERARLEAAALAVTTREAALCRTPAKSTGQPCRNYLLGGYLHCAVHLDDNERERWLRERRGR